jgi:hypothetical protein
MIIPTKIRNQGPNEKDKETEPDQETEWRSQAERKRDGEKESERRGENEKARRKERGRERKKEREQVERPTAGGFHRRGFPTAYDKANVSRVIRGDGVEIIFLHV